MSSGFLSSGFLSSRFFLAAAAAACLFAGVNAAQAQSADLAELTAVEALVMLQGGKTTSAALVAAALERARAASDLNAFITLDEVGALAQAKAADEARKAGKPLGPLHGLPIVVKDNIHVAGLPSSAGTPALAAFMPKQDAPVVAALRNAGAIVLGKTNMHELAFGISGYNEAFHGAFVGVRNAYDRKLMAGGSSSGTAAAIGARIVAAGLGTDTGGSMRVPAALNGVAGFRPSVGRYDASGVAPISHTRDTPGPMGRTVADAALLDAVISGTPAAAPAVPAQTKLGVCRACFFINLDADTKAATETALGKLKAAGFQLVDVDMPGLAETNGKVSFPVALYEAYDDLQAYLAKYGTGLTVEAVAAKVASADVKGTYAALVIPRKLPGPDGLVDARPIYDAAIATGRPALQKLYADTFAKYGVAALVFPTTPHVAIEQNGAASSLENFILFIQNTDPGSNAGIPGLSIPAALSPAGLPIGIEVDGPAGSDRALLAIGLAIEQTLGRLPPPK